MHISCGKKQAVKSYRATQASDSIVYSSICIRVLILYLNFISLSHKIILRIQVRCTVFNKILLYSTSYLTVK